MLPYICSNLQNIQHQRWTLRWTITFGWLQCVNVISFFRKCVPFWGMMLIGEEACVEAGAVGETSISPSQFYCKPKTPLKKLSLLKIHWTVNLRWEHFIQVCDNSIKRFKHQIKMSGLTSDLLNQNLWAKGMLVFIFIKHPRMILMYTEVWEPLIWKSTFWISNTKEK